MTDSVRDNGKRILSVIVVMLMIMECFMVFAPVASNAMDGFTTYDLSEDVGVENLSVTWRYQYNTTLTKSGTVYDHIDETANGSNGNLLEIFLNNNSASADENEVRFTAKCSQLRYSNGTKTTSGYPEVKSTLSITNTSSFAMEISFNFSLLFGSTSPGKISVDGTEYLQNYSDQFSKTVAAGESIEIAINPRDRVNSEGTVTLTNITAKAEASQEVTFKAASGGSYVVAANGTTYPITEDQTISIDLSTPVTLTATPDSGKRFAYWSGDDNIIFSSENGVTLNKIPGSTVAPLFVDEDAGANFVTGSGVECFYWEEAFQTAAFFEDNTVIVLAGEHSLPTTLAANGLSSDGEYVKEVNGEVRYIVPDGFTFLVPYAKRSNGTYDTTVTGRANSADHTSAYTTAYSTLVLNFGTKVVVNGTMIVGAQQHTTGGGGKIMGEVGAKCGAVKLMGGDLDVYGVLHARGYIYDPTQHTPGNGNGKVTAEDGADVYVFLQLNDFRGGTASLQGSNNNELALNVYYFNNILATTEFKYGSELYGKAMLFAGDTFMEAETALVTNDDNIESLIVMQSDSEFLTDYDVENDVFIMDIVRGHAKVKNLKVQLGSFSLDTEGKTLPINEGINIIIDTGAVVDVYCSLKCLPGFKMYINEGATVNMHKSLYLYSVGTYQQSWARDEMRRRQNCEFIRNGGQLIAPTEDAAVYLDGTVNMDEGLKIFESDDHAGSIIPGENARFNTLSYMSYSANTDFLYEIPGTVSNQSQYARVTNWEVFKGPIADLSSDVSDAASFSRDNGIEAGNYSTVDLGDGYYWYRYAVSYENGGDTVATHYHAIQTTDVLTSAELEAAGQRRVVTNYTPTVSGGETITVSGGWDESGTLMPNPMALGWENVQIAGVNSDTTVDLTLAPFEHRVIWTVNSAAPFAHYINGASDIYTDTVVASVSSLSVSDENGAAANVTAVPVYGDSETSVEISGIDRDIRAAVTTSTEFVLVTWNLTYGTDGGNAVYYSRVAEGNSECIFAIPQIDDNAWYVADASSDITVTGGASAEAGKETVTLTGITDAGVTANVNLTKYDQKVAFDVTGSDAVYGDRYINNGGAIEISTIDGYIFDAENCYVTYFDGNGYVVDPNASAVVSNEKRTLTVSGTTHTDNVVMVAMAAYDCAVSFRLDNNEVRVEYIENGGEASYTLPDHVAFVDLSIEGIATDASVNATSDGRAVLRVTGVQSDVTVSAGTIRYRSIVSFHETVGAETTVRKVYLPVGATSVEYTAEAGKVVTAVSGGLVTGPDTGTVNASDVSLGWESFTVSALGDSDSNVYVTLREYDNRVTWIVREDEDSETVVHYVAGGVDEYNTESGYVIRSYQVSYSGNPAVTDSSSKTRFALSAIDGEPTVTLTIVRYTSVVTFEDANHNPLSGPIYVDETGRNIFVAGGEVFYEPEASYVITSAEFAEGSGTLNAPRWAKARFGNDALAGFRDEIVLTDLSEGTVVVTVTERRYDAKVTWNVTLDSEEETYTKFIVGTTDMYTVTDTEETDYAVEVTGSYKLTASVSADEKTVLVSNIVDGAIISVTITDRAAKGLFTGHSITLNGDVNVNFYVDLTDDQIAEGATITYTWRGGEKTAEYTLNAGDFVSGRGFKAMLELPAAEMSYPVHAVVTVGGEVQEETNDFSVRDYALAVLEDPESPENLKTLLKTMLNYGAMAQIAFDRTDVTLANAGVDYTMPYADANMVGEAIDDCPENAGKTSSDMTNGTEAFGVKYYAASLVYLSGCSLRQYYTVSDNGAFGNIAHQFNSSKAPYYYVEKTGIPAAELDELQEFVIGSNHYYYSALDFIKAVMENRAADSADYRLAQATYWYNQAANAFFAN